MIATTDVPTLQGNAETLLEEVFGPFTLLVRYRNDDELAAALSMLPGGLTSTLHSEAGEELAGLVKRLEERRRCDGSHARWRIRMPNLHSCPQRSARTIPWASHVASMEF